MTCPVSAGGDDAGVTYLTESVCTAIKIGARGKGADCLATVRLAMQ
jgi:hypothetical protein